jgi:hypothetical protein
MKSKNESKKPLCITMVFYTVKFDRYDNLYKYIHSTIQNQCDMLLLPMPYHFHLDNLVSHGSFDPSPTAQVFWFAETKHGSIPLSSTRDPRAGSPCGVSGWEASSQTQN